MNNQIASPIHSAVDQLNERLEPEQQITADDGTVLLGSGAVLDSLGLVNFLVILEDLVEQELGTPVNVLGPDTAEYLPTERNAPCLEFWRGESGFSTDDNRVFKRDLAREYAYPAQVKADHPPR